MTIQAGFSRTAAAFADPAREVMLTALADGRARTAGELAILAGISPQNASAHLHKLLDADIITVWPQGRRRYFRVEDEHVINAIEALIGATVRSHTTRPAASGVSTGLCFARHCYNHIAGSLGVALADTMLRNGDIVVSGRNADLTPDGRARLRHGEIASSDTDPVEHPFRLCLDWTERRPHLAGPVATAILQHLIDIGGVIRARNDRALRVTPPGRAWFIRMGLPRNATEPSVHSRPPQQSQW